MYMYSNTHSTEPKNREFYVLSAGEKHKNKTNIVFLFGLKRKLDVLEFLVVTQLLPQVLVFLVQLLASYLIGTTLMLLLIILLTSCDYQLK